MTEKRTCPQCGAERDDDSLSGLCPKCLARYSLLELEDNAGAAKSAEKPERTVALTPESDFEVERTGLMIGRYKLLQQIGEGGFGVVYLAEQVEPVQRKVALKIIKAGMDTKEIVARFEAERQALALMDHPNIAQVFDGGVTHGGRPYFVMELVRGMPITGFCDQRNLDTSQRLRLFIQVCKAVQHAHQKGIIHRDLKPSNILVTLHEGEPMPKIIDFGVAKALGAKLNGKTLFTGFLKMVGTPAYMSPEQAELNGMDIDTRSDIYSLGVLLYELLTGVTPFDAETIRKAALDQMRRIIRETDPPRPSNRLQTLGNRLTDVAKRRRIEAAKLIHLLRGDLDWIVMRCLEKDRKRRYETANSLAREVQRHLDNEPVDARPPSAWYLLGRMIRRHWLKFVAGGAVGASLVIGLTISTALYFQEEAAKRNSLNQKRRADQQAAIAATISEFLQHDLLAQASGDFFDEELPEPDLKVRTLLDRASERIEGRFVDKPLVEASLRMTLGKAYHKLGEYVTMEQHARHAFEIYTRELGTTNAKTLYAAWWLADAQGHLGRAEAVPLIEHILETERQVVGAGNTNTLKTMKFLASAYAGAGRPKSAHALLDDAIKLARVELGAKNIQTADLMSALAKVLEEQGQWKESLNKLEEVLAVEKKHYGPESFAVGVTLGDMARILVSSGRPGEAEPMARKALDLVRAKGQGEHPIVVHTLVTLADCLKDQGKRAEAEKIYAEAEKRLVESLEESTVSPLRCIEMLEELSRILVCEGNFAEAEARCREALAISSKIDCPTYPATLNIFVDITRVLVQQQRCSEAETFAREKLNRCAKEWGDQSLISARSMLLTANTLLNRDNKEAASLLTRAVRIFREQLGPDHETTVGALAELAEALNALNKPAAVQEICEQILPIEAKLYGPEHTNTIATTIVLATALKKQGKLDDAEALLEPLLPMLRTNPGSELTRAKAMYLLGQIWEQQGRKADAALMMAEAHKILPVETWFNSLGPGDLDGLRASHSLSHQFDRQHLPRKAFAVRERLLPLETKMLGPENKETRCTLNHLVGRSLSPLELKRARKVLADFLVSQRAATNSDSATTMKVMFHLADIAVRLGHLATAERWLREARDVGTTNHVSRHLDSVARDNLADVLCRQGKTEEAESLYEREWKTPGKSGVRVSVNGKPISGAQVAAFRLGKQDSVLGEHVGAEGTGEKKLEAVITGELIVRDFERRGQQISEEALDTAIAKMIRESYYGDTNIFDQVLRKKGETEADFREQTRHRWTVADATREIEDDQEPPSAADIEEFYRAHLNDFQVKEQVCLRTITIERAGTNTIAVNESPRERAAQIYARLVEGEDFAAEARSVDESLKAKNGGYMGWVELEALRKEVKKSVVRLNPGELSEVIETPEAFFIVKMEDRRPARIKPLAEVKNKIRHKLTAERRATAVRLWLDELRSNAVIRYF